MDWPDKGVPRGTRLPDRTRAYKGGHKGRTTRYAAAGSYKGVQGRTTRYAAAGSYGRPVWPPYPAEYLGRSTSCKTMAILLKM